MERPFTRGGGGPTLYNISSSKISVDTIDELWRVGIGINYKLKQHTYMMYKLTFQDIMVRF